MAIANKTFIWDFNMLKRFYEKYVVNWINSAANWTTAQKQQALQNLGVIGTQEQSTTRTYTGVANGVKNTMDTPIETGERIIEITGVSDYISLYDEDNTLKRVLASELPFTADKKYVAFVKYVDETPIPEYTFTVESITAVTTGLIDNLEESISTNTASINLINSTINNQANEINEAKASITSLQEVLTSTSEETRVYSSLEARGVNVDFSSPIEIGESIDAFTVVDKVRLFEDGDETGVVVNNTDLPYTTTVKFVKYRAWFDETRPSFTMTVSKPGRKGLDTVQDDIAANSSAIRANTAAINAAVSAISGIQSDVSDLKHTINGTACTTRTYTGVANGVKNVMETPIETGERIIEITGVSDYISLYDEDNTLKRVLASELPFTADKKYVAFVKYVNETPRPEYTFTVESIGEQGLEDIVSELQSDIQSGVSEFPNTYIPQKIYGVIGDTMQLFNNGVTISTMPNRYYNDWVCSQGKIYQRYLEVTPALVGGAVPAGLTIAHRLIDDHYNKSEQKTSDFVIAGRPSASPVSNINVLCVGASTTANGEWASELKRRLTDTLNSGSPAADGLNNITFVGRKEFTAGNTRPVPVNVEATGGWTWKTFYTPQDAIRFTVSGISSINIGDVYTYQNSNGQTVKVAVAEINVTENSGNIRFIYNYDTVGKGAPATQSGSISRVSGNGDTAIAYTNAVLENYCPFYNNGEPDFSAYAATYCNNKIDVAIFNLGNINFGLMGNDSLTTIISDMKTMLDALHTDFPNCKVIIVPGMRYSTYYGLEEDYNASSKYKSWPALYAQFRYAKAIEEFIADASYKDWCFLADSMAEVDAENVFPVSTKAVNTRVSTTEVIGTNGAHPTLEGYQMVADAIYRCFVNVVLN